MSFKMTITVDVDDNPSAIGEALRSMFFDEQLQPLQPWMKEAGVGPYRTRGCYETFDWQKDVTALPALPVLAEEEEREMGEWNGTPETWTRGEKNGIECRYYWDGDGVLAFRLPDGRWLVNYDCKKDHGWELMENGEEP